MIAKIAAAVMIAVVAAAPAHAAKPQIQWDKQFDFTNVKTYQWQAPPAESLAQSDPFMHSFIQSQIEAKLNEAGLTKTDGTPDMFVTYHASTRNDVQLHSDSFGYGIGGYGMGGWGVYGYGMGPVSTTTRVENYTKGTLVVDIWDPTQKQLVWRGTSPELLISDDKAKLQKNVGKAIDAMVKQNRKLRAKGST
jgi:hypothetical protein